MSHPDRGLAAVTRAVPVSGMNATPSARPWLGCFCANPDGWFDPDRGAVNTESTVANMQRVGARLARVEFPWFLIEPDRGSLYWSRVDHIVSTVKKAGLRLHVQVLYPPAWAATGSTTPGPSCEVVTNTFASGVPDPADYASFVGALVRHVQVTNPGGLPYLEIGNEYDLPHYFSGTPADYVASQPTPGVSRVFATSLCNSNRSAVTNSCSDSTSRSLMPRGRTMPTEPAYGLSKSRPADSFVAAGP
jgi:hypothetical protein